MAGERQSRQCCSFCRRPGHNRTTCVARQTEKVVKLREELKAEEALLEAVKAKAAALKEKLDKALEDSDDGFEKVDK